MNEQIQRSSFGCTSRESILGSVIQESKVLKWKQRFLTSFVIKHTWQTPVHNCEKAIQKQDRDRAMFPGLHFISARSTANRQKDDSMSPTGMYGMSWQIAVAQSIQIVKVSQRNFWTGWLARFSNGTNHRRLIQKVSFSLERKYGMSGKHIVPRLIF